MCKLPANESQPAALICWLTARMDHEGWKLFNRGWRQETSGKMSSNECLFLAISGPQDCLFLKDSYLGVRLGPVAHRGPATGRLIMVFVASFDILQIDFFCFINQHKEMRPWEGKMELERDGTKNGSTHRRG